GGALDRAGAERDVDGLLLDVREASDTRVLAVHRDAAPVTEARLSLVPVSAITNAIEWAFLGRSSDGAALLLAVVEEQSHAVVPAEARWEPLRVI
ncbi:hypothetical protein ACQUFG_16630, partial [Enterococcus gallinarum]|uniref:hypothetical protein n=1 Tax=Enterococcus gallinarum TaxID=1353 RepID=UPI003D1099F3